MCVQHNIGVWVWNKKCMPRVYPPGFCRRCFPSIIKCGKRLTSRTLESVRAQWQTVGWPRHRDPCHHLHMRCPLFSLTCQTLSSCAQSICILLRSADCNWFPTMLARHTHSTRPAALWHGGAPEVAAPSVGVVVLLIQHFFCKEPVSLQWSCSPPFSPISPQVPLNLWDSDSSLPQRLAKDDYNFTLFFSSSPPKGRTTTSILLDSLAFLMPKFHRFQPQAKKRNATSPRKL